MAVEGVKAQVTNLRQQGVVSLKKAKWLFHLINADGS